MAGLIRTVRWLMLVVGQNDRLANVCVLHADAAGIAQRRFYSGANGVSGRQLIIAEVEKRCEVLARQGVDLERHFGLRLCDGDGIPAVLRSCDPDGAAGNGWTGLCDVAVFARALKGPGIMLEIRNVIT